ncbi:hydrogenase maturation protease [Catalinimonas sp. 4WD22]|uniref:hydrogenase maturation protease n=1 Tax=Catalinimonas locisalis TaxID=3133978 RepID=UPI00310149FA
MVQGNITSSITKKTVIMGFGNPVRRDDGVGVFAAQQLMKEMKGEDKVKVLDMGTSAFEVLFQLRGFEKIILIDAVVHSGEPAGTVFRMPAEKVKASIQEDPLVFLHAMKWDQALSYARKILRDDFPEDITVYLVAVDDTAMDDHMSEIACEAAQKVIALVKNELCVS